MAIAFDASSTGSSGGSPLIWTHTFGGGANGIVIVGAWMGTVDDGAATYDGVAMTLAVKQQAGIDNLWHYLWYLVGPPTGAKTVSVTGTVSYGTTQGAAATYTGVDQVTPLDGTAGGTSPGYLASFTVTITTAQANSWAVQWGRGSFFSGEFYSDAVTNRQVAGNGSVLGDSNGVLGAAGNYNGTLNAPPAQIEPLCTVMAGLAAAASAPTLMPRLTLLGAG